MTKYLIKYLISFTNSSLKNKSLHKNKINFQMSEMNLSGLLYSLPSTDPYCSPEYVPVPLTSVNIRAKVVNFITEVSFVFCETS